MRIIYLLLCAFTVISFGGCAFGHRAEYRGSSNFEAPTAKDSVLALAAQDEREYVLSGNKSANFVGNVRSLYGIPYSVVTTSGEPLADELGSLLTGALQKNGANVSLVKVPVGTSAAAGIALLKTTGATSYYLFQIREWKTETYMNTNLEYDVSLTVIDNSGFNLATKSSKGVDKLGSRPNRMNLATAVSSIFGDLINDPVIVSASSVTQKQDELSSGPTARLVIPSPGSKIEPCSVEQIFDMKKLGLSEDRIKLACK